MFFKLTRMVAALVSDWQVFIASSTECIVKQCAHQVQAGFSLIAYKAGALIC